VIAPDLVASASVVDDQALLRFDGKRAVVLGAVQGIGEQAVFPYPMADD
jgi:hypothetical protein